MQSKDAEKFIYSSLLALNLNTKPLKYFIAIILLSYHLLLSCLGSICLILAIAVKHRSELIILVLIRKLP